jgi:hypothetical protein
MGQSPLIAALDWHILNRNIPVRIRNNCFVDNLTHSPKDLSSVVMENGSEQSWSHRIEPERPNSSLLQSGIHNLVSLVVGDRGTESGDGSPTLRDNAERFTAEALKVVPLFIPRLNRVAAVAGFGGSLVVNALDQAKTKDSFSNQIADLALGGAKGLVMQGSFNLINERQNWNWATKGVTTGMSMRMAQTGFSHDALIDDSGHVSFGRALGRVNRC